MAPEYQKSGSRCTSIVSEHNLAFIAAPITALRAVTVTIPTASPSATANIPPPPQASSSSHSLSGGAIAGIATGCILGGLLLAIAVFFFLFLRRRPHFGGSGPKNNNGLAEEKKLAVGDDVYFSKAELPGEDSPAAAPAELQGSGPAVHEAEGDVRLAEMSPVELPATEEEAVRGSVRASPALSSGIR
jgi:hypothetical protein